MKRKQNKGFTELLIVVAIVGVLVAISIPIFSKQLKKARFATNQANARAAVSASVQYYYEADDSELEKVRNEKIMDGRIYLLYDCKLHTDIVPVRSFRKSYISIIVMVESVNLDLNRYLSGLWMMISDMDRPSSQIVSIRSGSATSKQMAVVPQSLCVGID